jgi:hypothetical protein
MTHDMKHTDISRRTAVFVDGDNISSQFASTILNHARRMGRVDTTRVYVDDTHCTGWQGTPGFRIIHSGSGKNATDMLLSIDAIECALVQGITACVIATSDQDYRHLAHRLREKGLFVLGVGESKAPEAFRTACHEFETLVPKKPKPVAPCMAPLDRQICQIIRKHASGGTRMSFKDLNPKMRAEHGTKISDQPEKNWRAYLTKRPDLFAVDPRGEGAQVQIKKAALDALSKH